MNVVEYAAFFILGKISFYLTCFLTNMFLTNMFFNKHVFSQTQLKQVFLGLLASPPFLGLFGLCPFIWAFWFSALFGLFGLFPFWPFGLHPFLGYTLSAMSGQDWLPTKRCTSRTIPL